MSAPGKRSRGRRNPSPARDLAGQRVLLTGASGGLGPYIGRALVSRGARLVLTALPGAALDEAVRELGAGYGDVKAIPADLTCRQDVDLLLATIASEHGPVDVLVNGAGAEQMLAFDRHTLAELERIVAVNLIAPMELTRRLLPGMLERGRGHIVNIASLAAKAGAPFAASYGATKAGLVALTRSLRAEYRYRGVSASSVLPGFVHGRGMYQRAIEESGIRVSGLVGTVAPERVAEAVVRAVEKDVPEIILHPGPTRLLAALGEIFPDLGARIARWTGSEDVLRAWADLNASKRITFRTTDPSPDGSLRVEGEP